MKLYKETEMNKVTTIAVGTAAGITLFVGGALVLVRGGALVHSYNEGKVSDQFKQKMNIAIKTYEQVEKMDNFDPQFKVVLGQLNNQKNDVSPVTEREEWIHKDLSDLYFRQESRQGSTMYNVLCKPTPKKDDVDFCKRLDEQKRQTDKDDLSELKMLKSFTDYKE
jgi:hypothetical protein